MPRELLHGVVPLLCRRLSRRGVLAGKQVAAARAVRDVPV
jgi:hypothetical protein